MAINNTNRSVGGSFTWYTGQLDSDNKNVKLKDFNVKIEFHRGNNGNYNHVIVANNNTTIHSSIYSNNEHKAVIPLQSREEATFLDILGLDGDTNTFSQTDFDALLNKNNKTTKVNDRHSYRVNVIDKTKGIVDIILCTLNADGTSKETGSKFTVDVVTQSEIADANKKDFKERKTASVDSDNSTKSESFIETLKNKYNEFKKERTEKKEADYQKKLKVYSVKLQDNSKGGYEITPYKDGYNVKVNKETTLYELAMYLGADPLAIAEENRYEFVGEENIGSVIASAKRDNASIESWKEITVPVGANLTVPIER